MATSLKGPLSANYARLFCSRLLDARLNDDRSTSENGEVKAYYIYFLFVHEGGFHGDGSVVH